MLSKAGQLYHILNSIRSEKNFTVGSLIYQLKSLEPHTLILCGREDNGELHSCCYQPDMEIKVIKGKKYLVISL